MISVTCSCSEIQRHEGDQRLVDEVTLLEDVCALLLNTWVGVAGLLLGGRVASYDNKPSHGF